jgi:hypothetical protein
VSFHPSTESIIDHGDEKMAITKKRANSLVPKSGRSRSGLGRTRTVRKLEGDLERYSLFQARPDLDVKNAMKALRKKFMVVTVLAKKLDYRSGTATAPRPDIDAEHVNSIDFTWRVFIHDKALGVSVCHSISLLHEMPTGDQSFFWKPSEKGLKRKLAMDKELLYQCSHDANKRTFASVKHDVTPGQTKNQQNCYDWEWEEKDAFGNDVGMKNCFRLYRSDKSRRVFPGFTVETGVDYVLEINGRKFEPVDVQFKEEKHRKSNMQSNGSSLSGLPLKGRSSLGVDSVTSRLGCYGCSLGISRGFESDIHRNDHGTIERKLSSMHSNDSYNPAQTDNPETDKRKKAALHYLLVNSVDNIPKAECPPGNDTPQRGYYGYGNVGYHAQKTHRDSIQAY